METTEQLHRHFSVNTDRHALTLVPDTWATLNVMPRKQVKKKMKRYIIEKKRKKKKRYHLKTSEIWPNGNISMFSVQRAKKKRTEAKSSVDGSTRLLHY